MSQNGITEVGKYRVIDRIGEGAMGVVYRALDPVLNRTVAIKVMSDALARDDELRSRFLREAQAAGSLQHPNVITVYDFGEVNGHLFIAMEFVAGHDLEAMLRERAPMTVVDKIDILIGVLGGLGYAHKRGVVHRDIKPANIRIDEEGRARIMDFGIAHLTSSTLTRTGLMVGTPAYMAPEQVMGSTVSAQTDIFSVGAVMYELFSGNKPFEGESLQSVFYKIVSQPPPDLTTVSPALPASLNTIVMQALAKDPLERYPTAADMANALTDARARLDRVSSQPKALSLNSSITSGLSARITRPMPVQRARQPVVVAGAAGALLLVATVGIVWTLKSRASVRPAVSTPAAAALTTAPPAPAAPNSVSTAPQGAVVPPAPQTTTASPPPKTVDKTAARSQAKSETGPSEHELSLFRSLQTAALETRKRAGDAGATVEHLRPGDDHNVLANAAAQQGKVTEAAAHVNLASAAWAAAERDARTAAASAAAAQAKTRVEAPKPDPVLPPAAATSAPPPAATVPAPTAAQPQRSAAPNPAIEIEAIVTAYERAIDSRDLAEMRRAYPGMTGVQAKGWEDFFGALRSIHATLASSGLEVRGEAAEAKITGTYDYVTNAGKTIRQVVNFSASFRREGGAWRLVAVR